MASELPRAETRDVTPATAPVAVIVGAGPGLGFAVAVRFAREKYQVALLARDRVKIEKLAEEIVAATNGRALAIQCDCSDPKSVDEAFQAAQSLGNIDVLVYNANIPFPWPPPKFTDISLEKFENCLKVQCTGAFLCAQQVLPGMEERKKGSVLFTGATASLRGSANFAELACGKFALRGLSQCLAREYGPKGIHVAHVIVDGVINTPSIKKMMPNRSEETLLDPNAIAESYWHLHYQNPSAWTQELDLRPFCEKF